MKTPPKAYFYAYGFLLFSAMYSTLFCFGAWKQNELSKALYPSNPHSIAGHFERAEVKQERLPFIVEETLRRQAMRVAEAKQEHHVSIHKKKLVKISMRDLIDTIATMPAEIDTFHPTAEYQPKIKISPHK